MLPSDARKFKPEWIDWKIFIPVGFLWGFLLYGIAGIDWLTFLNSEHADLSTLEFYPPDINYAAVMVLACITAGGVAAVLHPMMFWTALAMMMGVVFLMAISVYKYEGVRVSWLLHAVGVFAAGVSVFGLKEVRRFDMMIRMRNSLERVVNKKSLRLLEKDPDYLDVRDRQVPVSVLAAELVGFVDLLNNHHHESVTACFRNIYNELTKTTHSLGGLVLPGYNGHFLCVFGDSLIEGSPVLKHAESALQAAIQIQRDQAVRIRMLAGSKEPILTLKIGVASARCFISNIGTIENLEFAVFGTAIEEAQHLSRSCDMGSIIFSRMTHDLLVGIDHETSPFIKKLVNSLSAVDELIEVYSFDPLYDKATLRQEVFDVIRESGKYERKDSRHAIRDARQILVTTNVGPGEILNISRSGFGLKLNVAVVPGSSIRVKIEGGNPTLVERLKNREMSSFGAEVRWSSGSGTDFIHGLVYKSMREEDRDFLLQCVLETQPQSGRRRAV